jgi:hypothetical protein
VAKLATKLKLKYPLYPHTLLKSISLSLDVQAFCLRAHLRRRWKEEEQKAAFDGRKHRRLLNKGRMGKKKKKESEEESNRAKRRSGDSNDSNDRLKGARSQQPNA